MKLYNFDDSCNYYDYIETSEEEDRERNLFLERIFKRYNIKSIFDLTCGTGAQAIYFLRKGYKVKASDYSKGMVSVANKKLRKLNMKNRFQVADMRTVNLGKADAVITMFNAIGNLSKADFEKTLLNIKDNLKPKGFYIFDIYNLNVLPNGLPLKKHIDVIKEIGDLYLVRFCENKVNLKKGVLSTKHKLYIQHGIRPYRVIKNDWDMQIYVYKELKEMLERNGYRILEVYGGPDFSKFEDMNSESIYLVTQKK